MKKLALFLVIALTVLASIAPAQVTIQLDATGCFDLQSGTSCTLTPHTYPSAEADEDGDTWTRDCLHTARQGFTCPFNFPPGITAAGGVVPVTASVRANFPGGAGTTTTAICTGMAIVCRDTPSLATDTGGDFVEQGEADYAVTNPSITPVEFTVENSDTRAFLHKNFVVSVSDPGATGARCELIVFREPVDDTFCDDVTNATIGYEYFLIEFPAP